MCDEAKLWQALQRSFKAGVGIVQLRDKRGSARETLAFARRIQKFLDDRIPFIVNDRVDIALLSGASGVHVGQEDLPVTEARKVLGARKIIGTSCQTIAHLRRAVAEGADYAGFGSVFKTLTKPDRSAMKPDLLKSAARFARDSQMPMFAIGGITGNNLSLVLSCGVERVAVCRDILLADNIASSVEVLRRKLD